jgi:hypothetical protein
LIVTILNVMPINIFFSKFAYSLQTLVLSCLK